MTTNHATPPVGIFSPKELQQIIDSDLANLPAQHTKAIVVATDTTGVSAAARFSMGPDQRWTVEGAAEHTWTGENKVGGKLIISWCLLICALLFGGGTASAQAVGPDAAANRATVWTSHTRAADIASTVLVAGALAEPCLVDRTRRCLETEALRVGLGVGIAEIVKRLVHRERPDGSNALSFFSEHTELACLATVRGRAWAVCPAVGYLRMAADKHWLTDVGTGAAVGALLTTINWP